MSWIDQHPDGGRLRRHRGNQERGSKTSEAMSRLGAAVHVITTDGPAARPGYGDRGVSVSDAADLLVCLNRGATSMPILRGNGVFSQHAPRRRRTDR
jgi:flavin reductase